MVSLTSTKPFTLICWLLWLPDDFQIVNYSTSRHNCKLYWVRTNDQVKFSELKECIVLQSVSRANQSCNLREFFICRYSWQLYLTWNSTLASLLTLNDFSCSYLISLVSNFVGFLCDNFFYSIKLCSRSSHITTTVTNARIYSTPLDHNPRHAPKLVISRSDQHLLRCDDESANILIR
jgi:hypothetical protein